MTIDFFNKRVINGYRIHVDNIDEWPSSEPHIFKIPVSIETFLYSPFVDSFYPQYIFGPDKCRYNIGTKPRSLDLRKKWASCSVPFMNDRDYIESLVTMDHKIRFLFTSKTKKILVLYDHSRAGKPTRERLEHYNNKAIHILSARGWSVVKVFDKDFSEQRWMHYSHEVRQNLLKEIERLEQ